MDATRAWALIAEAFFGDPSFPFDEEGYRELTEGAAEAGVAVTPAGVPAAALSAMVRACTEEIWEKEISDIDEGARDMLRRLSRIARRSVIEGGYGIGDCAAALLHDAAQTFVAGAPPTRPQLLTRQQKDEGGGRDGR
eukprot:gene11003-8563_t